MLSFCVFVNVAFLSKISLADHKIVCARGNIAYRKGRAFSRARWIVVKLNFDTP